MQKLQFSTGNKTIKALKIPGSFSPVNQQEICPLLMGKGHDLSAWQIIQLQGSVFE